MRTELLFEEYRGDILECLHFGTAAVVDKSGLVSALGDSDWPCFYRSASKPIQALPTLIRGLHRQYGLTEEEAAIFSGSHRGDEDHQRVCESILEKTGLKEEDMIMSPVFPRRPDREEAYIRSGLPRRKIFHNCSGKHLCLMLLSRALGEDERDYWRPESKAQRAVREMVAYMSDTPYEQVGVGVDGCGVPVFAVPFYRIACAYLKLACPELIGDGEVRSAVEANVARLHAYPNMIAGAGSLDTIMTADPDLIAKSGAQGVYAIGIRSKGLGVVFKTVDGSHATMPDEAAEALRQLGAAPKTEAAVRAAFPPVIRNNNNLDVGFRKSVFTLL